MCMGEGLRGLLQITCLEVEALKKGVEDGDIDLASHRATYGPSNDPEPDYNHIELREAMAFPTPGY